MTNPFKKKRASAGARGYGPEWYAARSDYLRKHRFCAFHLEMGLHVRATVVDHVTPHRGDKVLFWNQDNWQPLCTSCHNSKTASMDGGGYNKQVRDDVVMRGCKENGEPADPHHHWNRRESLKAPRGGANSFKRNRF